MATAGTSSENTKLVLLDYKKMAGGSFKRQTHNISAIVSTMKAKTGEDFVRKCYLHPAWIVASSREGRDHLNVHSKYDMKADYYETAAVGKKNFYLANTDTEERSSLRTLNFPVSRFLTEEQTASRQRKAIRDKASPLPKDFDQIHSGVFTIVKHNNITERAIFFDPYTPAYLPMETLPRLVSGLAMEFKISNVTVIRGDQGKENDCLNHTANYLYTLLNGIIPSEKMGSSMSVKKHK